MRRALGRERNVSPTPDWFPSKRDRWLVAVIWISELFGLAVCGVAAMAVPPGQTSSLLALAFASLFLGFGPWVLYGTGYRMGAEELRIQAGPFRWRVPFAAIDRVEPSNNPLSSPACSLDRLLIVYGGKQIMVSPERRAEFLEQLALRCPWLRRQGERLARPA
jgi:hypothetical protein